MCSTFSKAHHNKHRRGALARIARSEQSACPDVPRGRDQNSLAPTVGVISMILQVLKNNVMIPTSWLHVKSGNRPLADSLSKLFTYATAVSTRNIIFKLQNQSHSAVLQQLKLQHIAMYTKRVSRKKQWSITDPFCSIIPVMMLWIVYG